ncbi:hypothetical protein LWC35_20040 [Pseudonocardia kujensis]|uniref:hypothetical protein n=1 Tax=Pseudonocardia kujensis TaxID=1128675 RepID=UPI001E33137D|nr:hypothetical protein [Pseudonocardia kujensis]MCE0765173.1 hypothetical protein [Pseudonocardia kujensis]
MSLGDAFELPPDARVRHTGGRGPLLSRVQWQHADGSTATWESRLARKRGFIEVVRDGTVTRILARPAVAVRLRRCNDLSGVSFFLGGALFTLGALLAQYGGAPLSALDWTFLIGGFWFSTGAYAALVQELNSPRKIGEDGALAARPWRWWAYEPARPGWVAAFVLFCGTLAFAISLLDAFLSGLSTRQVDRVVWAPEVVGCVLFLLSGHVAILEVCHGRFRVMTSSLGWWIVIVNQVGSWLFMLSGLAAFVRPVTGEAISVGVINWGTAVGAACFSAAGLAQLFERPAVARPVVRDPGAGRAPQAVPGRGTATRKPPPDSVPGR